MMKVELKWNGKSEKVEDGGFEDEIHGEVHWKLP